MMDFPNNNLISIFQYAFEILRSKYDDNEAKNIATLMFRKYFNYSRADLVVKAEEKLSESEILLIHKALKKMKEGEPVQYVLGSTEFYGLEFEVDESVLIPRPETEELVNWIIEDYKSEKGLTILDVGTGTGCIAISLDKNLDFEVKACDISEAALKLAGRNNKLNQTMVEFAQCDFLANPPDLTDLDIIVSNPPYIPIKEKEDMDDHVLDYEPDIALFVENEDPILFYKSIAEYGLKSLKPGGSIYYEINPVYVSEVGEMLFNLEYTDIQIRKDISGKDRMIRAKKAVPN